jgi:hypothetical protein
MVAGKRKTDQIIGKGKAKHEKLTSNIMENENELTRHCPCLMLWG